MWRRKLFNNAPSFRGYIGFSGGSTVRHNSTVEIPQTNHNTTGPVQTTVFSGIQPTGSLHLGNYFGAVQLWTSIQNDPSRQLVASVVDMHAITLPWDPKALRENIQQMFVELLACGIDPDKTVLFQQSSVPEHAQLQWIFSCLTTMARLDNLPHFKEKSATQKEIPCGLFLYPVLQAADILLYRARLVPVGEDQVHHLHLAQHIARVFNNNHGTFFPSPARMQSELPRVKSFRDPTKKMSKSDPNPKSRIEIRDDPKTIRAKCKAAITDFPAEIAYDPENRPGVSNLLMLLKMAHGGTLEEVLDDMKSKDKVALKAALADSIIELLRPIQERIEYLNNHLDYVEQVKREGTNKARELGSDTLVRVQNLVGFRSDGRSISEIKKMKV